MPPRYQLRGTRRSRRLKRLLRTGVGLIVLVALIVCGLWVADRTPTKQAPTSTSSSRSRPTTTNAVIPSTFTVPTATLIATLHGPAPSYASATAPAATGSVSPVWSGSTLGLPVIEIRRGRCHVRLLQRPNGQTAWIATTDVSLTRTDYHVVVDLSAKRLILYRRSKVVLQAPAVVGSPQSPTPTGHFFVGLFAQAPDPTYGPFVIVTSAFATTVTDWEQGGQSMVAITGPLGALAAIQHGGAPLSRGGIRLADGDMARLRPLPAGAPIDVVATLVPAKPRRHHRSTPVG
jgi:L,D-transpeptidase catalytic domain